MDSQSFKAVERRYGCTLGQCLKKCETQRKWERHENKHYIGGGWRCSLPAEGHDQCARLFEKDEAFIRHLVSVHDVVEGSDTMKDCLLKNRIGRQAQSTFWCGFCGEILPLTEKGIAAYRERHVHIGGHYNEGKRIDDWLMESGHRTKGVLPDQVKRKRQEKGLGSEDEVSSDYEPLSYDSDIEG
jgi:hypothetical protein